MDRRSIIDCLINSISRFIHLITCHDANNTPVLKLFRNSISVLKLLKSILDELLVSQLSLDDQLVNVIEQVDVFVNESREMLESLPLKTSTLYNVSFIFFHYLKCNQLIFVYLCFIFVCVRPYEGFAVWTIASETS